MLWMIMIGLVWFCLFIVAVGLYGALLGSYAIMYWSRYRTGTRNVRKILDDKNCFCLSCNKRLRVIDQIPIVSYLRYKGRCKYCGSPIGREILVGEILGGLLLLATLYFRPFWVLLIILFPPLFWIIGKVRRKAPKSETGD